MINVGILTGLYYIEHSNEETKEKVFRRQEVASEPFDADRILDLTGVLSSLSC
jgi:hypothetical protein